MRTSRDINYVQNTSLRRTLRTKDIFETFIMYKRRLRDIQRFKDLELFFFKSEGKTVGIREGL